MKLKHLRFLIVILTPLCITFNAFFLAAYVEAIGSPRTMILLPLLAGIVLIPLFAILFERIGWV